jgi:hypothetical protein
MTQTNVETILGRLITDEAFRRRFRLDRTAELDLLARQGLELNATERTELLSFDLSRCEAVGHAIGARLRRASSLPVTNPKRTTS